MISYHVIEPEEFDGYAGLSRDKLADFLFVNLDEFGDKRMDIMRCIEYALDTANGRGGFIVVAQDNDIIVGAVIINYTGMKGYIPENILVYIATHRDYRGQGIGKKLMEFTINRAKGDIALHVEPHNPAKYLYEKYDFKNKYLEMRYLKNKSRESHKD